MRILNRKTANHRNRNLLLLVGAASGAVVVRSLTKRARKYSGMKLKRSIEVGRSPAELYAFWRNVENLPKITDVLASVKSMGGTWSQWTIRGVGVELTWDSEITADRENEMIGWRSKEGSSIETAGYVRFSPGRDGTVVRVALEYSLPAGKIGAALASIFGNRPGAVIEDALRRFKQLMETGEVACAEMKKVDLKKAG
jgi:uncharacterized membrane protein